MKCRDTNRVLLSNDVFFGEVKNLLEAGRQVRIPVQGQSMRPFLRDGDTVVLAPAGVRDIRKGTVVLARTAQGVVLHRVVKLDKQELTLAGDANAFRVEKADWAQVAGMVVAAGRNGRELPWHSFPLRVAVCLWRLIRPLNGYLLAAYDRLKKKKKHEAES